MIPKQYAFLWEEPGPKLLVEALAWYGTQEKLGPKNTPVIMGWAKELGPDMAKVYTADSIPWCGLFMAYIAWRAGKDLPASPLWARAWASWGDKSPEASLGDVLVFSRIGGGHVGLYVGETLTYYHVLGGNQSDGVNIKLIAKSRCIAVRRQYRYGPPANVRKLFFEGGKLSTSEA